MRNMTCRSVCDAVDAACAGFFLAAGNVINSLTAIKDYRSCDANDTLIDAGLKTFPNGSMLLFDAFNNN